ncbi:cell division protein [Natronobeatus ordinarius]|uniref:cell division protein n=1 Tax=Natronobeatus ordinarius TaxID=2963433 RepID=UPI0020CCFFF9|nr:cell division protein [Natronobeatus ordinarius]
MAQAGNSELVDAFEQFFRNYYDNEVKQLAQRYPNEQRSLSVDWNDLYRFDPDLADDYLNQPEQLQRYAEEALRLYDLPIDVSLGQAHVRIRNLPDSESPEIREIRARHMNRLVQVRGIIRKATDVRPKIEEAAFECQLCGTLNRVPQSTGDFQEPHECQGCERQGPFRVNFDQSEFVDAQKLRIQESPEGLRGGETPQAIDVHVEDDITGEVTPGDHVSAVGVLRLEQQGNQQEKSPIFDFYMEGISVDVDEEQFEDMDITEEDKQEIVRLSGEDDIYEKMIGSIAPAIFGYDDEKLAMILQLFSGVTKQLPDGSRIRGDLHMLLIGDPGTGKCVSGDTCVTLADDREVPIRTLVESNLEDPKPIDDGWWDEIDLEVPSVQDDGSIAPQRATKVWKREAPDRMYRIRTSSGRELEVTPSHPLFVFDPTDGYEAIRADELSVGDGVAAEPKGGVSGEVADDVIADGGVHRRRATTDSIVSIETSEPDYEWVYDLEVEGTHNYVSNGIVSHNSQMLGYIQNIAPRSVYTSGKGSSSAGLTAAAVRDDFGDGQQWTLEAGALVLADQGIAAVDELDKMRCVTGETLVELADGSTVPIRDVARSHELEGTIEHLENGRTIRDVDISVRTMTEDGAIIERPVTAVHQYDAPAELIEVVTEDGNRLRSTSDHPFFVYENGHVVERAAEHLEPGDDTLAPRSESIAATDGGAVLADSSVDSSLRDVEPREIVEVRRIDGGDRESVYDLTVSGTHNFLANGMVVHNSEDRSAMHEALEQQKISVSKAGINATLKSRCSLLGAANPKYGRFDQYEPIGEQIDLEPALISRFDLIFTVTDQPDEEKDRDLAEHIINTNYAGELTTQQREMTSLEVSTEEIEAMTAKVDPVIDAELLRKYIAYAKQNCHPRMTEAAREAIRDFYVDLRSKGTDEDAPVPVTARKLEGLVRLSEASARVRLSDTVELEDAQRVIEIVRSCLQDIGVDPETGEFDADIVEAGTSKSQRDRIKNIKGLIADVEEEYDDGAPIDVVLERAGEIGMDESKAEHEIEKLKQKGEVYEPSTDHLRTT